MVLDDLTQKEKQIGAVSTLAVIVALLIGYGAGSIGADKMSSQGSADEVRSVADSLVSQQKVSQIQRLRMAANQSENISMNDLSFNAEVENVSESDIGSLYEVDISLKGDTVSRLGQVQSIDRTQTVFISGDGRYLFQQPIDLEAQQQSQTTQPSTPSGETQ